MRRVCALSMLLTLLFGTAPPAATEPQPEASEDKDKSAEETPAEQDKPEPVLRAPADPVLEVGLGGHTLLWDTPYGGNELHGMVGLSARWLPGRLGALSFDINWARRAPEAADLRVANHHVAATLGGGVNGWLDAFRLGAELRGGLLFRSLRLDDGAATRFSELRVLPVVGVDAHLGFSFWEFLSLSLVTGTRFWAPNRADIHFGLRLDWFVLTGGK